MVVHACNASNHEAEVGGSLSLRPPWAAKYKASPDSIEETLSQTKERQINKGMVLALKIKTYIDQWIRIEKQEISSLWSVTGVPTAQQGKGWSLQQC